MQRFIAPIFLALCLSFSHWAAAGVPRTVEQLNSHPPRIVVSTEPARLMLIDGPPALAGIPATSIEFVVNTDWDVFHDRKSDRWYVLDQGAWLEGNMLASGDWRTTSELPRDFLSLQVSPDWPRVAAAMPPVEPAERPARIVISYEPTELIVVEGEMQFEAVGGGGLEYVRNTGSDLFRLDGRFYYRAAGRWFTTRDVDRKWYPVKTLPRAFAEIPAGHPRARVLESVPGTEAARLAAEAAAQPQRREITTDAGADLVVPWFGEPSFVAIDGTALQRGENTPYQVIRHNNFYYLCHEGAWFSSTEPRGRWRAAREIPEEIYSIPATDPAFNVTFVRLEAFDDSSERMAYVATSGYYSRYYNGSTMVYGTGWYYPGYRRDYAYWRYPQTYGYHGPRGGYYPYNYSRSETYDVTRRESDWEWNLDGTKRRVYRYGPEHNTVGGTYVMPESDRPVKDRP
jgi:hypothetical protein